MEVLPRKQVGAGARLACSALLAVLWLAGAPLAAARVGFAGYIEASGFDKAVLLANTGRHAVDLAAGHWRLAIYFNGARQPAALIALRGTLAAHSRFWLVNDQAGPRLRGAATQLTPELNFNGNDAVVLLHGERIADSIGQIGDDPGTAWSAHGISTRDAVLVRRRGDIGRDRNPRDAFDPARQWRASTLGHLRQRHHPTRTQRIEQATIPAIQGSGLLSPLRGDRIGRVRGVVTAVTGDGFFMQAPQGDGNPRTSNGIFVYTRHRPAVRDGLRVAISGTVHEYRDRPADLTLTELHAWRVVRRGRAALPKPVLIGPGGRLPPTRLIFRGGHGRAIDQRPGPLPRDTGIGFLESLEGMRVRVVRPQVVGTGPGVGRFWVVADDGKGAAGMNRQGGITVRATPRGPDMNPERILVNCRWLPGRWPRPHMGQRFRAIVGVMGYRHGRYVLHATRITGAARAVPHHFQSLPHAAGGGLRLATYNVDNLGPEAAHGRMQRLAAQIVHRLGSPDLLALQEIEDDSGADDDGVTSARRTLGLLMRAIRAAGGPRYRALSVAPRNDADGGVPGANIRPALLYNPRRLHPVAERLGTATSPARLERRPLRLTPNPGRIDPGAGAFTDSRKPLVALFQAHGHALLAIDVHLTARRGSDPQWGRFQPPRLAGARQRRDQMRRITAFLRRIRRRAPHLPVVVLGDFNAMDFETALRPLANLRRPALHDLLNNLKPVERYTYIYQGNGEALDHVFVSAALTRGARVAIVHANSGLRNPVSDHDPVVAQLRWPAAAMLH